MPQHWHQTKLQGHVINLDLRIELVDNANESSKEITSIKFVNTIDNSRSPPKTSEVNFDDNGPSAQDDEALPLAVREYENGEVDSMAKLKERLQLAEKNCLRLEELYQKLYGMLPLPLKANTTPTLRTKGKYRRRIVAFELCCCVKLWFMGLEDAVTLADYLDARNDAKEMVLGGSAGGARVDRFSRSHGDCTFGFRTLDGMRH
ncbi:hypothetical protein BDR03DRAFT_979009 [Suillus americanus]|nr:hypothetical protein BDR03DRAFT_979009 [Suillus americanus]